MQKIHKGETVLQIPSISTQSRPFPPIAGFTLIEVVVVMLVLSVLIGMAAKITSGVQQSQLRSASTRALQGVDTTLANFVMVQRRLPCPADGALASTHPQAGLERRVAAACTDDQARGVVPWRTLGITEAEASDGYGNRLTYRVGADLVRDDALFMTACDAAGDGAAVAGVPGRCSAACVDSAAGVPAICTRPKAALTGVGLVIKNVAGMTIADPLADPPSGAAYVLLSHGANRGGAYGSSGVLQEPAGPLGAGEVQNTALDALKAYYVDDSLNETAVDHYDDAMLRLGVGALASRAGLGPRSHRPAP